MTGKIFDSFRSLQLWSSFGTIPVLISKLLQLAGVCTTLGAGSFDASALFHRGTYIVVADAALAAVSAI